MSSSRAVKRAGVLARHLSCPSRQGIVNFLRPFSTASVKEYRPPTLEEVGKAPAGLPPLRMTLIGAPGSGKGSFARYLSYYFNAPVISTGDLIRTEIKNKTEIGKHVKKLSEKGKLVEDEIVVSIVRKRLAELEAQTSGPQSYILDGFPRTVHQAMMLEEGSEGKMINTALHITLREDILIRKSLARRVCSNCGRGYNVANIDEDGIVMPALLPKREGHCDDCGGILTTRADDTKETIVNRLAIFKEQTQPVEALYRKKGVLVDWAVMKGLNDTPPLLAKVVAHLKSL